MRASGHRVQADMIGSTKYRSQTRPRAHCSLSSEQQNTYCRLVPPTVGGAWRAAGRMFRLPDNGAVRRDRVRGARQPAKLHMPINARVFNCSLRLRKLSEFVI